MMDGIGVSIHKNYCEDEIIYPNLCNVWNKRYSHGLLSFGLIR